MSDVKDEEYNDFYTDKFYDYEKPARIFRNVVEGKCSFTSNYYKFHILVAYQSF